LMASAPILAVKLARVFLLQLAIFVLEQDFPLAENGNLAGIHNDESFEIKNALEIAHGKCPAK